MLSFCFVLVILVHLCPENIKVPVNIQSSGNIELQIASIEKNIKTESCLNVKVLIINHTDTVVSFFEDWNSWGWYNIKFKIKTIDTTWFINKKDRDWPKNFPSYKTLFPGDTMELKYLFGYGSCNSSQFDNLLFEHSNKTVSFQVFYKLDKARCRQQPSRFTA